MIIGPQILLELVKTKKLVQHLSERELTIPEGAGFDLRLGQIHRIKGSAFLGINERETPEVELILSHHPKKKLQFTIQPDEFYLISTIETINLPHNITVNLKPRSTTFRSGLHIRSGNVAPGYKGTLTFGVKNEGPVPVTLELGCRIIHAQFYWVDGGGSLYRGQWQGGRVTTKKRERQV